MGSSARQFLISEGWRRARCCLCRRTCRRGHRWMPQLTWRQGSLGEGCRDCHHPFQAREIDALQDAVTRLRLLVSYVLHGVSVRSGSSGNRDSERCSSLRGSGRSALTSIFGSAGGRRCWPREANVAPCCASWTPWRWAWWKGGEGAFRLVVCPAWNFATAQRLHGAGLQPFQVPTLNPA